MEVSLRKLYHLLAFLILKALRGFLVYSSVEVRWGRTSGYQAGSQKSCLLEKLENWQGSVDGTFKFKEISF